MNSRYLFAAALVLAVATPALAAKMPAFKSVKVDLPNGDRMFADGPHADAINNNCLACHSAGMVLNQPPMSRAGWEGEVKKMKAVYKAPVDDKDIGPIVDYLMSIKGAK